MSTEQEQDDAPEFIEVSIEESEKRHERFLESLREQQEDTEEEDG